LLDGARLGRYEVGAEEGCGLPSGKGTLNVDEKSMFSCER